VAAEAGTISCTYARLELVCFPKLVQTVVVPHAALGNFQVVAKYFPLPNPACGTATPSEPVRASKASRK